jgi:hypothetical protein
MGSGVASPASAVAVRLSTHVSTRAGAGFAVGLDRKAIQQYRGRFNDLISEKADAEADGDHERLEEIQIEMAQLVSAVTGAQGKGGRLRKVADRRKNVRDAFRIAVDRPSHQADR